MAEHFQEVVDFVMSEDNGELGKTKAELAYALHSLEREIAIAHQAQTQNDVLVKALKSASVQCGNVIYNCEQRPADNQRHLDSWKSVKDFIDIALRSVVGTPST